MSRLHNLKKFNTLAVDSSCERYLSIQSLSDLESLPRDLKVSDMLVLAGGSNLLLSPQINRFVAHIKPRDHIEVVDNLVVAWAGTSWHELVVWAVSHQLGGIENLALIPGTVGAAPIQNIGAYGVELKDVLVWVEIYNWQTGGYHRLSNEECHFSYRHSIFRYHDRPWVISRIGLDLRPNRPVNLSYPALRDKLTRNKKPSYADIAKAVTEIRQSKLPNPKELPNAGSFFKNPIIDQDLAHRLQKKYKDMSFFNLDDKQDMVKTSAAWLLEKCGFKGKRIGDAGFYDKHALILVNHGKASSEDLQNLSRAAKKAVKSKFGITLEEEVRIV
ncbi:UDP-N-acetylmuramate dehydrogenase [Marinicella gelatinilytica]|uniref:UDP-N-acetylmuramate dehydrogenase n=1 Tax=Marinicella gelatinilytica TaxID=2996017 RepID=UPI002260A80B|nr:UDP-N-acetylmuramate dehydrogenase [Marinicella gelatinilytica]MCX7543821.1 UDP-N-acetylmuramate dehydrogenase [Marinicella gelatinilytica]